MQRMFLSLSSLEKWCLSAKISGLFSISPFGLTPQRFLRLFRKFVLTLALYKNATVGSLGGLERREAHLQVEHKGR